MLLTAALEVLSVTCPRAVVDTLAIVRSVLNVASASATSTVVRCPSSATKLSSSYRWKPAFETINVYAPGVTFAKVNAPEASDVVVMRVGPCSTTPADPTGAPSVVRTVPEIVAGVAAGALIGAVVNAVISTTAQQSLVNRTNILQACTECGAKPCFARAIFYQTSLL